MARSRLETGAQQAVQKAVAGLKYRLSALITAASS
jgi:hypothetical protein